MELEKPNRDHARAMQNDVKTARMLAKGMVEKPKDRS